MRWRLARCALVAFAVMAVPSAHAVPSLSFVIDGDTFAQPFAITNASDAGEKVLRFQLDLLTVTGEALVYDTVTGAPPNTSIGHDFAPVGGTDVTTGLVPLPGSPKVADGSTLLDIHFTGFDPGETFQWDIDIDAADGSPTTVTGDMMVGAQALIDFDDGQRLTGVLTPLHSNPDASVFEVTGTEPTPDVIPEPTTVALSLMGLGALTARRRRGRRK